MPRPAPLLCVVWWVWTYTCGTITTTQGTGSWHLPKLPVFLWFCFWGFCLFVVVVGQLFSFLYPHPVKMVNPQNSALSPSTVLHRHAVSPVRPSHALWRGVPQPLGGGNRGCFPTLTCYFTLDSGLRLNAYIVATFGACWPLPQSRCSRLGRHSAFLGGQPTVCGHFLLLLATAPSAPP